MAVIDVGVQKVVLGYLERGTKTLEVRGAGPYFKKVKKGDVLLFNTLLCRRVIRIASYRSFLEAVDGENYLKIMPTAESPEGVVKKLYEYMKSDGDRNGVLVFELAPV